MIDMNSAGLDRIDLDLIAAANALKAAQGELLYRREKAKEAALAALASGCTEVAVAEALGVNRLTIRKWRGK